MKCHNQCYLNQLDFERFIISNLSKCLRCFTLSDEHLPNKWYNIFTIPLVLILLKRSLTELSHSLILKAYT